MIKNRKTTMDYDDEIEIIKGIKIEGKFIVSPVLVSGDAVGAVIILSKDEINDLMEKTANFIAKFLGKHLQ